MGCVIRDAEGENLRDGTEPPPDPAREAGGFVRPADEATGPPPGGTTGHRPTYHETHETPPGRHGADGPPSPPDAQHEADDTPPKGASPGDEDVEYF